MEININFDFQHIKPAHFRPTCQHWKCIYSAWSHSLFMFICVHLIIALFRVRSCFGMGPFDGLQINSLKFGGFRCNECLMDTCIQLSLCRGVGGGWGLGVGGDQLSKNSLATVPSKMSHTGRPGGQVAHASCFICHLRF